MIPIHYTNLYQKPTAGTQFIARFPVYNYKHSINAIGGFDTASFDIALRSVDEMQQFLDQYLANRVAIYVDNPVEPVWEGFINRMTFTAGGTQYSISLDEMANRVTSHYAATLGSTNTTQSASVSDTNSQAIFGIKEEMLDLGVMNGGTGATLMQQTVLAQRAWPKTSMTQSSAGNSLLKIECKGFCRTLTWENYRLNATASVQLSAKVNQVRAALTNGTTFFDNTDSSQVASNTNSIDTAAVRGETAWDYLLKIREFGDTLNYWVIGITPTQFQTGKRVLYYRAFNSTIVYTARRSDGLRIRNLYGQLVPPWLVQPDAGIRISDDLIGWNGVGDNPTESYILKIDYDANAQTAIFSGDDDLTTEGIFNYNRYNRGINSQAKRFGAQRRLA